MKKRIISMVLILCLLMTSASALTVEQARDILSSHYIDEIPKEILELPTISEILQALGDPYTTYYTEQEYTDFRSSVEDTQLVGIGIRAYYLEEGVLLNQIAPNSPASETGLQVGDYIIAIDGNSTRGAVEDAVDGWIHGEAGSSVCLTILRGQEEFEVTAIRRQVVFPTVILEKIENKVGWISCSAFGSTTFQYFYDIVSAYDDVVDEWVIDLRGNGGGDVYAAIFSAGCFVGNRAVAYLRDQEGTYYRCQNIPSSITRLGYYDGDLSAYESIGFLTSDPVHVLTDRYTASAAEIFAAVVRDAGAGLIIGERTYGKGVAQTVFSADSNDDTIAEYFRKSDALKVTTERIFYAGGSTNDKVGVLPHISVASDLADEVAALLAAAISEEEDALYIRDLDSYFSRSGSMIIPMNMLQNPENAEAAAQLLSALPTSAFCVLRENGEQRRVSADEAASLLGITLSSRTFSDTETSDFAEEINTLGVYGIVSGDGDGTFRPTDQLDRASLCALLIKAARYPLSGSGHVFADVPEDAWYAPYVNAACKAGIITGDENGLLHPDAPVSHEKFLTILGQTAQRLNMDYYEYTRSDGIHGDILPDEETLAQLYGNYSEWARELVWLCDKNLIWADLTTIDPAVTITREEAAAAIFNLFQVSGLIPDP